MEKISPMFSKLLQRTAIEGSRNDFLAVLNIGPNEGLYDGVLIGLKDGHPVLIEGLWSKPTIASLNADLDLHFRKPKAPVYVMRSNGMEILSTKASTNEANRLMADLDIHPLLGTFIQSSDLTAAQHTSLVDWSKNNCPQLANGIMLLAQMARPAMRDEFWHRVDATAKEFWEILNLPTKSPPNFVHPSLACATFLMPLYKPTIVGTGHEAVSLLGKQLQVDHMWTSIIMNFRRSETPVYFVGTELVRALMSSDLASETPYTKIRWPHTASLFLFEPQALQQDKSFTEWLLVTKLKHNDKLQWISEHDVLSSLKPEQDQVIAMHNSVLRTSNNHNLHLEMANLATPLFTKWQDWLKGEPTLLNKPNKSTLSLAARLLKILELRPDLVKSYAKDSPYRLLGEKYTMQGLIGEPITTGRLSDINWEEPYRFKN